MKFYFVYLTGTGKNGETPGSPRYASNDKRHLKWCFSCLGSGSDFRGIR